MPSQPVVPGSSAQQLRPLTEHELADLLIRHCGNDVADIFDRCAIHSPSQIGFNQAAADRITELLANMSAPLVTDLIALSSGKPAESVQAMGFFARTLSSIKVVALTLQGPNSHGFGERVLHALFVAASKRSAAMSGNRVHH